jgi:hypothetical protein
MTAEVKMRTLAQQDPVLQSFFFTNSQIRWFDTQMPQGYLAIGRTCARVTRVSTIRLYSHETREHRADNRQELVRFQIDVLDYDSERARSAAKAIIDWLATVADFSSNAQFGSPVISPTKHPNMVLNQRQGMEAKTQPPVYVQMLDVRIQNLEE